SIAAMVFSKVAGAGSFAIASISARRSAMASSRPGLKCSTRTSSKGGKPPKAPGQERVSGFCMTVSSDFGARIVARKPRHEVIDLGTCGGRERRTVLARGVGSDDAAPHHHVFAYREPRTGLLLVADERKVRVEKRVRVVALAFLRQANDVDEHVGEAVT